MWRAGGLGKGGQDRPKGMDGTLTFVIPVRHPRSVDDWPSLCKRLNETLASVAGQSSSNWQGTIVVNRGVVLPPIPDQFQIAFVDFPFKPLPERTRNGEEFFETVRMDKGRRILAGLLEAKPEGHVMTVDYDDFVHNGLARMVGDNPHHNGWFFDHGYLYDGSFVLYEVREKFFEICGTSHVVRADLLSVPNSLGAPSDEYIRRALGSHRFIKDDLARAGTPLSSLPFPGAVYRIGYAGATIGSMSIRRKFFGYNSLRHPRRFLRHARRLRLLNETHRRTFSLPRS